MLGIQQVNAIVILCESQLTSPNTMDRRAKTWKQMTMMTQEKQNSKKRKVETMARKT